MKVNLVVASSVSSLSGRVGYAYVFFDDKLNILKYHLTQRILTSVLGSDVKYLIRSIDKNKNLVKEGVNRVYVLTHGIRRRRVDVLMKDVENLGSDVYKPFMELVDSVGSLHTVCPNIDKNTTVCQLCVSLSSLALRGVCANGVVNRLVGEVMKGIGTARGIEYAYKRAEHLRTVMNVADVNNGESVGRKSRCWVVVRSGPVGMDVYSVCRSKETAYDLVMRMNNELDRYRSILPTMARKLASCSYNIEGVDKEEKKGWGLEKPNLDRLLVITDCCRYNVYNVIERELT